MVILTTGKDIEPIKSVDVDSYTVKITFDDGTTGLVNLGFTFNNPKPMAAEVLAGDMFDKCVVLDGTITWPNGYDISPDVLYAQLVDREPNGNSVDPLDPLSIKARLQMTHVDRSSKIAQSPRPIFFLQACDPKI